MGKRKTHEEFIKDFNEVVSVVKKEKSSKFIKIIGNYKGCEVPIECECLVHKDIRWFTTPVILLKGCGCPECDTGGSKKLSQKNFLEKFNNSIGSSNLLILGNYKGERQKILCQCKHCKENFYLRPSKIYENKYGCSKCANKEASIKKTFSHERFINEFSKLEHFKNIAILGIYKGNTKRIKCQCKIDGHEWYVRAGSLLGGYGCPKCKIRLKTKTHEQFVEEFNKTYIKEYISILGTYTRIKDKIKCQCKIDNYIWESIPARLLRNVGCPVCNKLSFGEKFLRNLLNQLNIDYITQLSKKDMKWCGGYLYDFYIPCIDAIIEVHGMQHYKNAGFDFCGGRSLSEEEENDKNKHELAIKNEIDKYIVIDCRKSELGWIKNSILNSELNVLFDLSNIHWNECYGNTFKPESIDIIKLHKENKTRKEISQILKISLSKVRTYIKRFEALKQ